VGTQDGLHYLVSEFLEGQTLRERMGGGVLPQRKVSEYALQIANGLGAAHEKGIVHRDLKPENIFVTQNDHVKILDFGLAKQAQAIPGLTGETATMSTPGATAPGTVMGTVGYMSPEQVRGQGVDSRSDIFSFGAILYEMVAGRRAFKGDSGVETMNAILKEDPPEIDATQLKVSPGMERIVRHCLEKNPANRFQSARDLGFALGALSGSDATASLRAVTQAAPESKTAYSSHETGDWEIYVTTYPTAAGKWQVSRGGGVEPRWRGDGKELFYIGPKGMLTAVAVSNDGAFSAGNGTPLFRAQLRARVSSTDIFSYDVTKDGQKFLVNRYARSQAMSSPHIILNATASSSK
jgi:serine/threonine protein kinase